MERELLRDYMRFAVPLNTLTVLPILERAKAASVGLERKQLCTAGLQLLYGSCEDFAVLLHAILARKRQNVSLQVSLSGEGQRRGSTTFPAILKRPMLARSLFDEMGFVDITPKLLREFGYDVADDALNESFSDFASSIAYLATAAENYNHLKNRAKHGKAVWGVSFGLNGSDEIAHIEYGNSGRSIWRRTTASVQQLEVAAITIAKMAMRSLDLLLLFGGQYHRTDLDELIEIAGKTSDDLVTRFRAIGLQSPGLPE